jgi:hypothetical protein
MRVWICRLIVSVIMVGCAAAGDESLTTGNQGLAELRVDAAPLLAAGITRVTVDGAGQSQELVLNPATGTFDGVLFLPSGPQTLVASAFSGDTLVGRSRPTAVEVAAGAVTRIVIRILDLSVQAPPLFGPIVDSLSFPTTTQAGASASFAISAVAPAGDPVSYAWSSSCADATFSAPDAATTAWSKAAAGSCTVTVLVTSNGFSVALSLLIVVFPAGAGSGGVDVSGAFITAPAIELFLPGAGCNVFPGTNASCPFTLTSPSTTFYQVDVFSWGGSAVGTLDVTDDCGGRFGRSFRSPSDIGGSWLPPVGGGLCTLTAHAVNGDGLSSTLSAAILTRPGTLPMTQPPQIGVSLDTGCFFTGPGPVASCPPAQPGRQVSLFSSLGWADGAPGSVTLTDDCGGVQLEPDSTSAFTASWTPSGTPGRTCTTTVRATNLQGVTSEATGQYLLAAP